MRPESRSKFFYRIRIFFPVSVSEFFYILKLVSVFGTICLYTYVIEIICLLHPNKTVDQGFRFFLEISCKQSINLKKVLFKVFKILNLSFLCRIRTPSQFRFLDIFGVAYRLVCVTSKFQSIKHEKGKW